MKIAIVKSGVFGGGGISRVVECWARMLGNAGHDVTVISQASPRARELPPLDGVTTLLSEPPAATNRLSKLFGEARGVTGMLEELQRRRGIDLILSHNSLFSTRIAARLPTTPLLQTIHSPSVDENRLNNWKYAPSLSRRITYPGTWAIQWYIERQALKAIGHAHTLSEYTWRLLSARYPGVCRKTPWSMIPGTVDQKEFVATPDRNRVRRELGLAEDETILLSVRRLVPRNGVDRILHCADSLRSRLQNVRFLIGGTGALKEELERQARDRDLGGLVEFLGFIPEDRLVAYYQAADAFLIPTRDLECFGLPVIEATACGCPPLVMPDGGPAEICREFPDHIASANTSAAFTDLVWRFVSGEISRRIDDVDLWTRRHYSEESVQPTVLALIDRLGVRSG